MIAGASRTASASSWLHVATSHSLILLAFFKFFRLCCSVLSSCLLLRIVFFFRQMQPRGRAAMVCERWFSLFFSSSRVGAVERPCQRQRNLLQFGFFLTAALEGFFLRPIVSWRVFHATEAEERNFRFFCCFARVCSLSRDPVLQTGPFDGALNFDLLLAADLWWIIKINWLATEMRIRLVESIPGLSVLNQHIHQLFNRFFFSFSFRSFHIHPWWRRLFLGALFDVER